MVIRLNPLLLTVFKLKLQIFNDDDEKELDVICTLQLNMWNGNENIELIIEDILKK